MIALWIALACWLGLCLAFVALRVRATTNRATPVRRPLRTTQLRALRARATSAGAGAVLVAGPRR